ncbi:hypothetical protein QQF64_006915 [Cirrhinus molitorella]|uniref:Uncharacterized protein n=2 Tax=Cirrhinus molitorella TaxID=172907 RepID=A0AA88PPK6_9TELE|nr:hypothetical protein Q8A67_013465 [Cirrhinus molitorella]
MNSHPAPTRSPNIIPHLSFPSVSAGSTCSLYPVLALHRWTAPVHTPRTGPVSFQTTRSVLIGPDGCEGPPSPPLNQSAQEKCDSQSHAKISAFWSR